MIFEVKESTRALTVLVSVHPDGRVIVTKPLKMSLAKAESFMTKNQEWVERMQAKMIQSQKLQVCKYGTPIHLPKIRRGSKAYKEMIESARALVLERVKHFSHVGTFKYGNISIRNQTSRWGSCSSRGNLSFNYRIIHLPPQLVDYLIVHELSHTKEHNHSPAFWSEVEKLIPEGKEYRRELRRYSF